MIEQGEIYLADLDATAPHPVLVVSREELNRGDRFVAILITSGKFAVRATLPNCIPLRAGQFGLSKDCVAQCENIFLVDVNALHPGPLGKLNDLTMREVIKAIGYVMDSDCEPN
jgi:mRNA-degrading endonuclease toxin of MazEF toxin-antitoxin module